MNMYRIDLKVGHVSCPPNEVILEDLEGIISCVGMIYTTTCGNYMQ